MVAWIHVIFSLIFLIRWLFRRLIAASSFPILLRTANTTPIPKGTSLSQFPLEYRPIICKDYEKFISRRLYKFVGSIKVQPNT